MALGAMALDESSDCMSLLGLAGVDLAAADIDASEAAAGVAVEAVDVVVAERADGGGSQRSGWYW
jgi:hypothetical protein